MFTDDFLLVIDFGTIDLVGLVYRESLFCGISSFVYYEHLIEFLMLLRV